jgi:streptogramin lyase
MQGSGSHSDTLFNYRRSSSALRLFLAASLALLWLVVGGGSAPARAQGPALWLASPSQGAGTVGGLIEIRPFALTVSGAPHQVKLISGAAPLANAAGLAFAPSGAVWVCTLDNKILKFNPGQLSNLAINPHPTPVRRFTNTAALGVSIGCTFDSHVNLWIVDNGDAIHEISHAQLAAASGPIAPAVTITNSTDLTSPSFPLFDSAGNLWVSSLDNSHLVRFSAAQLTASGSPTPPIIISSNDLNQPGQMAFDSSGNLWVTNAGNSTVVSFTPAQLAASGAPAANVVLGDDGSGSLSTPWGLTFDSSNRLWVSNYTTGTLSKYGPGQLTASGSPTPRKSLTNLPMFAAQITFGPRY